jgi:hypothetical protein
VRRRKSLVQRSHYEEVIFKRKSSKAYCPELYIMTKQQIMLFFVCTGRPKLVKRVKMILLKLATLLYTKLVNLNMFPLRTFGSNIDRIRAKRLGQLATRLNIILLIISFAILTLYTVIQPQTLTKTFNKPSYNIYNRLLLDHNDTLQCPCSLISSMYDRYITIEPAFHQVRRENYPYMF